MKRWIKAVCVAGMVTVTLGLCGFVGVCREVQDNVVRLHVLANSDRAEDQALKYQVRDAVLVAGAGILDGVTDKQDAEQRLQAALPKLTEAAQRCVQQAGYAYPVRASLNTQYFTTRTYDDTTLPAGWYRAVRVVIGDGEGQNWWCVMYPPLCVSAATDKASLSDVMSDTAVKTVKQQQRYRVRFKVVELVTQVSEWLRRK